MKTDILEKKLEYEFRDISLLETALTHSSYNRETENRVQDNERLEFLGDGLLDAIIGRKLYEEMPNATEGKLTKTRALIVCEKSLAKIARELDLGSFLNIGHGEEHTGGRQKDSIIADAVEAVAGAVFIDGGYEVCSRMVLRLFEDTIRLAADGKLFMDYKSELQEKLQAAEGKNVNINYILDDEQGPPHDRVFYVHVENNGVTLGRGSGKRKQEAEQNAARQALEKAERGR